MTIWKGSDFTCPDQENEINLLHTGYTEGTASASCGLTGGAHVEGIGLQNVTDNQFTSQLTVPVSADLNGLSVECAHDDLQMTTTVDKATITVVTGIYSFILCHRTI